VYQRLIGIESKIEYHPFLEDWGNEYQSLLRRALNDRQKGLSENEIEKSYQRKYNIQWAWADSLATNSRSVFDQLTTAKENQISLLETDLKAGFKKVGESLENLDNAYSSPTQGNLRNFNKKLLGIKSKLERLKRKQQQLLKLQQEERLHICWGSKKLFKAQYNLEENGYTNHEEWLEDWRRKRGGNFYSVGKGSVNGNNPVTKIHHKKDDIFTVTITVPRCYQEIYENKITLEFEITKQRKHDLFYALESNKPVTVQIFRREHKDNQWYIHLSTYVQAVPYISHKKNGCLGIDLNAQSIDLVYVKRDGNLHQVNGQKTLFSWDIPTGTTGQVEASLRDIVAEIVRIGESYECPIACEDLDFSKKKATLRHSPKKYNRMLSGFVYDKFRAFLVARAEKYGIEVIFKNPFATSVIGMVKYMAKYGLNSAYAAAMVIARRANGFSERIPRSYWPYLGICTSSPEDKEVQSWGQWGKICKLLSKLKISRHQMFESAKVLEALQSAVSRTKRGKSPPRKERIVKSASKPVVFSNSIINGESPMPQNC
ncbi:MAG: IS200/IS605 family accessory protein TnpB-related protein, partial [Crocosphaera sp.]